LQYFIPQPDQFQETQMTDKPSSKTETIRSETVLNTVLVAVFVGSVVWSAVVSAMPTITGLV
jgi:hypothetical protein